MKTRKEFDSIGGINVPNNRYWGASTQRSKKFFNIGKINVPPSLIRSIAIIKRSAAIVHQKDKLISKKISKSIIKASNEVISGKMDENFPLKVWQTGSGTQTNMNVNEVIEGDLKDDVISFEKDEIGKVLIKDDYPYAIIKIKNEKFDFGKTFNCGSAKVKIKKPDWLKIT